MLSAVMMIQLPEARLIQSGQLQRKMSRFKHTDLLKEHPSLQLPQQPRQRLQEGSRFSTSRQTLSTQPAPPPQPQRGDSTSREADSPCTTSPDSSKQPPARLQTP